ncbi:MAG: alanine dehydrogenase [Chloroflexi bacterium]|nr:alanine dehydrogenase [Chloroflexota bacterium]
MGFADCARSLANVIIFHWWGDSSSRLAPFRRFYEHWNHERASGAGFSDLEYQKVGGRIVYSPREAFGRADLVLKLARPLQDELQWLNPGATLMGFLHLASSRQDRVDALLNSKVTSVAYEQIQLADGTMPVLRPLSQIGGLMTAHIAATLLQTNYGGKGILLGGMAGVPPAEVVIIGSGTAGTNAARGFLGLGAHVTVLDKEISAYADVVVGAVLVPGERAPIVLTRETMKLMKPRSLAIDLSIDLGGCFETSRPTAHDHPTYVEEGVVHYCVPNVPAVVARSATHAFVNAALPYISEIAAKGIDRAMTENHAIEVAVTTYKGELLHLQRWTAEEGD